MRQGRNVNVGEDLRSLLPASIWTAMADGPLTSMPHRPAALEVAGNRLTLLADGPERLEALIALIDGARESLRILYYIFLDDAAGTRVRDALSAAADRGVAVSMLVDGFGSTANS